MAFEVKFDDTPYPLPPELQSLPLDHLPSDQTPDKLALADALGAIQRDVTRLSSRIQHSIKTQAEALAQVEEAVQAVEDQVKAQSLVKPPPPPPPTIEVEGGIDLEDVLPLFNQLNTQISQRITQLQQRVNPLSEELAKVKDDYRQKVEVDMINRVLPVVDSFERLFDSARHVDDPAMMKWLEGVRMIQGQMQAFLRTQGVEQIEAVGQPFDANTMAAIGTDPTNAVPLNVVTRVQRTGYRHAGRILRVPEVFVAKPITEEVRIAESQLTRQELLAKQREEEQADAQAEAGVPEPPKAAPPKAKTKPKPAPTPVAKPAQPPKPVEPAPPITVNGGEDKFAAIRAKAQAALEGLLNDEPLALDEPSPRPVETPKPRPEPPAPPSASEGGGWGNVGADAALPSKSVPLPEIEGGKPAATPPPLEGGAEYWADGSKVYDLRIALGLNLGEFWAKAFKAMDPDQIMDLGEQIEAEMMAIEEQELVRLAKGLEMPLEELLTHFRAA